MKKYIGTKIIEAAPAIRKGGKVYDANEIGRASCRERV